MGNTARNENVKYEVWKLERDQGGIGYRWAIWDNEKDSVIKSGLSRSADQAAKDAGFWLGFLTHYDQSVQQVKRP
jgi:hypothetical protein